MLDDFVLEIVRTFLGLPAWTAPGLFVVWLIARGAMADDASK
jgi:urea transporter